jgi:hypothetical protein
MNRPRLLKAKRAARYLGISYETFNAWRRDTKEPRLPEPVESRGLNYYVVDELDAFVDALKALRGRPAA